MDGDRHYEVAFDETVGFDYLYSVTNRQVYHPDVSEPKVLGAHRTETGRFNLGITSPSGLGDWSVMGGTSPNSLTTNLTGAAEIVPLPVYPFGSKLHRVSIETSELGSSYFLRLEKSEETEDSKGRTPIRLWREVFRSPAGFKIRQQARITRRPATSGRPFP